MDAKEYLSGINALRSAAKSRRRQAEEVAEAIAEVKKLCAWFEGIKDLHRIRAGALKLAEEYEAESRCRIEEINNLPEPASSILRLYWAEGLSFEEIGERLFYSENYVRQVHCKVIKKIDAGALFLSARIDGDT